MFRPLGLQLNETKTGIVCLTLGKQGLDFLGFHLHKVESWKWKGRFYLQRWPSRKTMASIRDKIKAATDRANVGKSLATVVKELNPIISGWGNQYRHGNSARKFAIIDSYVHERLASHDGPAHDQLRALVLALVDLVDKPAGEVAALKAEAGKHSGNSSKAPSGDTAAQRQAAKARRQEWVNKGKAKRPRGKQPGAP